MDFADVSLVALRVFREVAERGTLTSAAVALGYTHVYWYRGGRDAWQAAWLAMEPVQATPI